MPREEKKYKARVVNRVLYPVIGLFIWTIFSFAMVEISIENFGNEENYLMLGLYLAIIVVGYAGLLYDRRALSGGGRRRRSAALRLQPAFGDPSGDRSAANAKDPGRGAAIKRTEALGGESVQFAGLCPDGPGRFYGQLSLDAAGDDIGCGGRGRWAAIGRTRIVGGDLAGL